MWVASLFTTLQSRDLLHFLPRWEAVVCTLWDSKADSCFTFAKLQSREFLFYGAQKPRAASLFTRLGNRRFYTMTGKKLRVDSLFTKLQNRDLLHFLPGWKVVVFTLWRQKAASFYSMTLRRSFCPMTLHKMWVTSLFYNTATPWFASLFTKLQSREFLFSDVQKPWVAPLFTELQSRSFYSIRPQCCESLRFLPNYKR